MQEEKEKSLRKLLELDAVPKVADPQTVNNVISQFLAAANGKTQHAPQLIGIGGGPGAGKTFLYENLKSAGMLVADAVLHDPDLVMQSIPEYRVDASLDPVAAFIKWELPARQLANEILLKAVLAGYHIIYIRTFALPDALQFVQAARAYGYQFTAHIVTCDLEVALARAQERERQSQGHLPAEMLRQRHASVLKLIPEIISIADRYYIYENSKNGCLPAVTSSSLQGEVVELKDVYCHRHAL